jgi:hypothetical protein
MEAAISIPDPTFKEAERLARRLGLSLSELYAQAVNAYLEIYREDDAVTEALNRVYAEESSAPDPVLTQLQLASLPKEEW